MNEAGTSKDWRILQATGQRHRRMVELEAAVYRDHSLRHVPI